MKTYLIISFLVWAGVHAHAQSHFSHFEVEADPIAYLLNGYSLHGVFVSHRIRTDLGVFGIQQPEGYGGNRGFQVYSKGVGMKINYLLGNKQKWFSGVGFGYSNNNVRHLETRISQVQKTLSFGGHIGYRWFAFERAKGALRNLYIAPWASIDFNTPLEKATFSEAKYKASRITFFPTVHLGYKFRY